MASKQPRTVSHAQAEALLIRLGISPEHIVEILGDYPDPIDLTQAEPELFTKYGISQGALMEHMGGSP